MIYKLVLFFLLVTFGLRNSFDLIINNLDKVRVLPLQHCNNILWRARYCIQSKMAMKHIYGSVLSLPCPNNSATSGHWGMSILWVILTLWHWLDWCFPNFSWAFFQFLQLFSESIFFALLCLQMSVYKCHIIVESVNLAMEIAQTNIVCLQERFCFLKKVSGKTYHYQDDMVGFLNVALSLVSDWLGDRVEYYLSFRCNNCRTVVDCVIKEGALK